MLLLLIFHHAVLVLRGEQVANGLPDRRHIAHVLALFVSGDEVEDGILYDVLQLLVYVEVIDVEEGVVYEGDDEVDLDHVLFLLPLTVQGLPVIPDELKPPVPQVVQQTLELLVIQTLE